MADPLSSVTQTTSTGTSNTDAQESIARLSEDFDAFLSLLTTQLRNQDPLSPVDTTEFTNQLVQFASVEQLIKQNDHLETLIANQELDRNIAAAQYVGAYVEVPSRVTDLINSTASWTYELPREAASVQVDIADANGLIVRTFEGPKDAAVHRVVWDGTDNDGNQLEDGAFQIGVRAIDLEGEPILPSYRAFGQVTSVDTTGTEPRLTVYGQAQNISDVSAISF